LVVESDIHLELLYWGVRAMSIRNGVE
jgi:hypothetical protein